jgi:type 4 prepilin peptidase 1 (EC:3.4.23.43). Aspartic peptidase. MEROPS family A24A
MTLVDLLQHDPSLLAAVCGVFGLLVGSFLNVVILRLPRRMEAGWRREARALLELPDDDAPPPPGLWSPPSHCLSCGATIRPWHNLPVLSWLWLRGRAACCGARLSWQYPLVELLTGVLAAVCALRFGWSPQLPAALLLTFALLALAGIDLRTQLLPDDITLPLLWLGLLLSLVPVFTSPVTAILGAAIGYLALWALYHVFRLLTGKEGMGYGDFKLLAALGAWFGAAALPVILIIAALLGTAVGLGLIALRRQDRSQPIAFGPWLALAGWVMLIGGSDLQRVLLP